MKIAIVRGPSLNKFEMQYYEPLSIKYEIVCFTSTKAVYDISKINLPIIKLPCLAQLVGFIPGSIKAFYYLQGDPQGLLGLEQKLAGFDIVHTAETTTYYTHQALLAKKKGLVKKVVATVSENIPFNQENYPRQRILKKFALQNLDHILAISNLSKETLLMEGYPQEKITVVGHGLDLDVFKKQKKDTVLAQSLGLKLDDFVILSVGRLVWEKGFYTLLWTAKKLANDKDLKGLDLKFLFVGDGPERKNLERLAQRLALQKMIVFVSSLAYDEIIKVYNLADIFVLASNSARYWQEQFGMVLIEAAACSVPVVASHSGAIYEVVADSGIKFAAGDWLKLAHLLKDLIKNDKLRSDFAKKGQEQAKKRFDKNIIAKQIEAVYNKVIKES